jgi:hypothetical protein
MRATTETSGAGRYSEGVWEEFMKKFAAMLMLATAAAACQTTAPTAADTKPAADAKPMAATAAAAPAAPAAPAAWKAKRGPDGQHPDLNGVWQAMNTANFNIEAHPAQSAMQLRPGPYVPVPAAEVVALGSIGAVPAGVGIVQGDGKIVINVRIVEQPSGKVIATPEFYQRASAIAGAWTLGAHDNSMLQRVTALVANYLSGNYNEAVGGATGYEP